MKKKPLILVSISIILLGIFFFAASRFYHKEEVKRVEAVTKTDSTLFARDYSPKLGEEKAKIQLVEFLDPQCSSCQRMSPHVKSLMTAFPGKIQLVVRYVTLHSHSEFAVKILEASKKQGRFWEALDMVFEHQKEWGNHQNPQPDLLWKYLPDAGVDVERAKQDINDPAIMDVIEQDRRDLKELNVKSTPTFFVNGKMVMGYGPEDLKMEIEAELAK